MVSDSTITTIGLDADDTLWHNERYFQESEHAFCELLAGYSDAATVKAELLSVERRNLAQYGFGIKGFVLSMVETALQVSDHAVPQDTIAQILTMGRRMLDHPVTLLEGVEDTVRALADDFQLVLITKGDLFDQERKIEASGLADQFLAMEIVSDKTAEVYRRIFDEHGHGVRRAAMVGNSLKSDVLPAIAAGAIGVHIPHEHLWVHEQVELDIAPQRFHSIETISELPTLLESLNA